LAVGYDGHRLRFSELPEQVRVRLDDELGARVVEAENCQGGFSPSLAARCVLDDGRRVFVKAVSPAQNPDSPDILRREASVSASLPGGVPAPRLLAMMDDGCWIVTVYEFIDGRLPANPWEPEELDQVIDATWQLAGVEPPASLPTVTQQYGPILNGWRNLASEPPAGGVLDEWTNRHLERLAGLEPQWEEAAAGDGLVHGDVRSDNVLLDGDSVTFVDWSSACRGSAAFDVVSMLASIALEGGGIPEEVLARGGGERIDPEALTALAIADAGYFLDRARLPDPPGLPTVRSFQRAQGEIVLAWLKRRLGWT
jgi:hypothetical protein